jgi:protein-L-isoaspartate(D-aspartate) O-methyltransferase
MMSMSAQTTKNLQQGSTDERRMMVDCQIRTYDVTNFDLIEQFYAVPRERYLPVTLAHLAYSDHPLPLETGRNALAPMVLARMLAGADPVRDDRVLMIGGAGGYSSAILAPLVHTITMIESNSALFTIAQYMAIPNVTYVQGVLAQGAPQFAPYDLIVIEGGVEHIPVTLLQQVRDGGRLVAINKSPNDPTGAAAKAVRFEKIIGISGQGWSKRALFDASSKVLEGFADTPTFAF